MEEQLRVIREHLEKLNKSAVINFDPSTLLQRASLFFLQIQQAISKISTLEQGLKRIEAGLEENRRLLRRLNQKT